MNTRMCCLCWSLVFGVIVGIHHQSNGSLLLSCIQFPNPCHIPSDFPWLTPLSSFKLHLLVAFLILILLNWLSIQLAINHRNCRCMSNHVESPVTQLLKLSIIQMLGITLILSDSGSKVLWHSVDRCALLTQFPPCHRILWLVAYADTVSWRAHLDEAP